ncbi:MAG: CinA family protein [Acidimicrobiia bacterium]|nr:CinA family protein [Acidimicrobiia bacterium]
MTSSEATPVFADLAATANAIAGALTTRSELVGIAESSTGGLISAALLSVPGASSYFLGGSIIYTGRARGLLFERGELPDDLRGATEPYAEHLALGAQAKLRSDWGVSETGAAGPTGNPYGDPPGHSWVAVARPDGSTVARNVLTGDDDRAANMFRFAAAGLDLLLEQLG